VICPSGKFAELVQQIGFLAQVPSAEKLPRLTPMDALVQSLSGK